MAVCGILAVAEMHFELFRNVESQALPLVWPYLVTKRTGSQLN